MSGLSCCARLRPNLSNYSGEFPFDFSTSLHGLGGAQRGLQTPFIFMLFRKTRQLAHGKCLFSETYFEKSPREENKNAVS